MSPKEKRAYLKNALKIGGNTQQQEAYLDLCMKYESCFSEHDADLGLTETIKHDIKMKTEDPIHIKQFRIPYSQRSFIEKKVNTLVELGVIEESTSPYNTPIFAVPKKALDGALPQHTGSSKT